MTPRLIDRIRATVPVDTWIPKPESTGKYKVVGWGESRGEEALVYEIPAEAGSLKASRKRVTASAFELSFSALQTAEGFTKSWFDEHLPDMARDGACNFTTIGGVFILLGEALYASRGRYAKIEPEIGRPSNKAGRQAVTGDGANMKRRS